MLQLPRYIVYDIIRSKVVLLYTAFLLAICFSFFSMEENSYKAILSLLNIVLLVVPLVSIIFATIHFYNSYEFIQLMLSQPISRSRILLSEYAGVVFSLSVGFIAGVGLPVLLYSNNFSGWALVLSGLLLTWVFTAIAFWAAVKARDKAKGIGVALLLWFYFAILYDGLLLIVLFGLQDYPMEKATLAMAACNPIDLTRIFMMLQLDVSALMGYTGALYKDFFGSAWGILFTTGILLLWVALPLWHAVYSFNKKDL